MALGKIFLKLNFPVTLQNFFKKKIYYFFKTLEKCLLLVA